MGAVGLSIDTGPLDAWVGRIGAAEAELDRAAAAALGEAARVLADAERAAAPVGETGELRAGIGVGTVTASTAQVVSTSDHHRYVHEGRGEVRPVNARALHFFVGGREVFTMRAGPVAPNPFWTDTFAAQKGRIAEVFAAKFRAAISAAIG